MPSEARGPRGSELAPPSPSVGGGGRGRRGSSFWGEQCGLGPEEHLLKVKAWLLGLSRALPRRSRMPKCVWERVWERVHECGPARDCGPASGHLQSTWLGPAGCFRLGLAEMKPDLIVAGGGPEDGPELVTHARAHTRTRRHAQSRTDVHARTHERVHRHT